MKDKTTRNIQYLHRKIKFQEMLVLHQLQICRVQSVIKFIDFKQNDSFSDENYFNDTGMCDESNISHNIGENTDKNREVERISTHDDNGETVTIMMTLFKIQIKFCYQQ